MPENTAISLRPAQQRMRWLNIGLLGLMLISLSTCSPAPSPLERIMNSGVLRVATYNSGTTYYEGSIGPTGFEYDLAKGFAEHLGVGLRIILADSPHDALRQLERGRADFAAGLTITPDRSRRFRFSIPVHKTQPELVYRLGRKKPKAWSDISTTIVVGEGSSHAERLERLANQSNDKQLTVDWVSTNEMNSEGLLGEVAEGNIAYTIADSHLIDINMRYYSQLRVAFNVGAEEALGWAFPKRPSYDNLYNNSVAYLWDLKTNRTLYEIADRHFSTIGDKTYVGAAIFAKQAQTVLPKYRDAFEKYALINDFDWRLLAAVGYQESHWNPNAVSPTGVRGLMMLTNATARFVKVNRLDAIQSIKGGAKYLRYVKEQLPATIEEPDRTWFALASYNVGLGHILDVRRICEELGDDPDKWINVRKHLPKLTQPRWHRKTRYGYARGYEPVQYVRNIRSYYDILVWLTAQEEMPDPEMVPEPLPDVRPEQRPVDIESPIL